MFEKYRSRRKAEKSRRVRKEAYIRRGHNIPIIRTPFTGEKTRGNLGYVKNYVPDYTTLALRSWQKYYESDIMQMLVENYTTWLIGKGLKLQSEPNRLVLNSENVKVTDEQFKRFTDITEARFNLHAKSKQSSYNRQDTLHNIAQEAERNAFIAGDCLVVVRYEKKGGVSAQLVDGLNVESPLYDVNTATGNRISHGVELNKRNQHVAYYIKNDKGGHTRISAKGSTGRTTAYLVYGNKYRIDYVRGVPLAAVVLETIAIMDRYKTATCSTAEEIAKVAYTIEHSRDSDGESPLKGKALQAFGNIKTDEEDVGETPEQLATRISLTEEKTVYNMPIGASLKTISNAGTMAFKEFTMTNIEIICSALSIPPEVALNKYNSNFSASRMASKSWEYVLMVKRDRFSSQFYEPIYTTFLDTEILKGKIVAPAYLDALINDEYMILNAYRSCRFVGANVPHVDPVKEVKAQREKLGDRSKGQLPLTTHDRATEELGTGDYIENVERIKTEEGMYNFKDNNND